MLSPGAVCKATHAYRVTTFTSRRRRFVSQENPRPVLLVRGVRLVSYCLRFACRSLSCCRCRVHKLVAPPLVPNRYVPRVERAFPFWQGLLMAGRGRAAERERMDDLWTISL